ncbi:hypothetical protein [Dyella humicola]|uniref:hypothetical protein n=1 Tax=Dyella humicola TaxID=2992126 RepID=UPI002252450E|nr:hypothetical protein [Dyella humicola]
MSIVLTEGLLGQGMNRDQIVLCAVECEKALTLESVYVSVEDWSSAAVYAERAEQESSWAFELAVCA